MKSVLVFFLAVFLCFEGSRLLRRARPRSAGLTGVEFLFLGILLGPEFLNVLDPATQRNLAPAGSMILGVIGLIFGFQFEIKTLRRFPPSWPFAAATGALAVVLFTGPCAFLALRSLAGLDTSSALVHAACLAALAIPSSQAGLVLAARFAPERLRETAGLLRYIASLDGAFALLLYMAALALNPAPAATARAFPEFSAILASLFMLFLLLLHQRRAREDIGLLAAGMVLFSSGAAAARGFSPLVSAFLLGAMVVNTSREKERVYQVLALLEKPMYLFLLLFLGAKWRLDSRAIIPAALAFWACRSFARLSGGWLLTRLSGLRAQPKSIGLGLMEHGGIAFAILHEYPAILPGSPATFAASAVLAALALAAAASPFLLARLFKGETA
jgi:hypothetical protein